MTCLTGILNSNILVISRKGKVLGVGLCDGVDEIGELIVDKVGGYIDPLLNERLLGVLSTKENVNLETLGFEGENVTKVSGDHQSDRYCRRASRNCIYVQVRTASMRLMILS